MLPNARSLSEQIYEWLKEKIVVGTLAGGQRIDVDALAAEIGVSRTPLRDALNRLAIEGLVVVQPRRGTVVGTLTLHDIEEVYEARIYLEPSICEAVAPEASARFVEDLERIQTEWESLDTSTIYRDFTATTRYTELNAAFHLRIVEETGNTRLKQILGQLYIQPRMTPLFYGSTYRGPGRRMAEHRAIIASFAERDPARSREAMRTHLRNALGDLTSFLLDASRARRESTLERKGIEIETRSS